MKQEMLFLCIWLIASESVSLEINNKTENNSSYALQENNYQCPSVYESDVSLGNNDCCNVTVQEFARAYDYGTVRLTSLLEKLRNWNCLQYEEQCKYRYFAFNDYSALVYERFCSPDEFTRKCSLVLAPIGLLNNEDMTSDNRVNISVQEYQAKILQFPCIQVAAYQYGKPYIEAADPINAYCGAIWCGFDANTSLAFGDSPWICTPTRCRVAIIAVMLLCACLAVATIVANVAVIYIIAHSPNSGSSQNIYKLSLAVGDLMIGLFVFPIGVASNYLTHIATRKRVLNVNTNFSRATESVALGEFHPEVNEHLRTNINQNFLSIAGYMTFLSLFVSIYSLMFATYDRYGAVSKPLKYTKGKASRFAKHSTFLIWLIAIILSLLPIFVPRLGPYKSVASGLIVTVSTTYGYLLIGITLVVPLAIVWILTIVTSWVAKKHSRARRNIVSVRTHKSINKMEVRLTKTLLIMVGVFTSSVLPPLLFLIIPEILPAAEKSNYRLPNIRATASGFLIGELIAAILLLSNSLWNCFIYSGRNKDFRKSLMCNFSCITAIFGCSKSESCRSCFQCLPNTNLYSTRRTSLFSLTTRKKSTATTVSAHSSSY